MLRKLAPLLVVAGMVAAPAAAAAEIMPGFEADDLAWRASDVVLADRLSASRFRVVQTWMGTLAPGEEIAVRQVPRPTATASCWTVDCAETKITGDRVVLFLARDGLTWKPATTMYRRGARRMRISVAWVQDGRAFAFIQPVNPGDLVLWQLDESEAELQALVEAYARDRRELADIDGLASSDDKLERLRPLTTSARAHVAAAAVTAMGRLGADAIEPLRALAQARPAPLHRVAVAALADAAGPDAPAQLGALLADETAFWRDQQKLVREVATHTNEGWWNATVRDLFGDAEREPLRDHYNRALDLLWQLAEARAAAPAEARAFCKLWTSLPPIGFDDVLDHRGWHEQPNSQIEDACRAARAMR
jgi:hypothetical protein